MGPRDDVLCRSYLYADDVACVLAHARKPRLQLAAWGNADDVQESLSDSGRKTAREKSENMLISPNDTMEDLHRRCPSNTQKGLFQVKTRDDQLAALREHVEEDNCPSPNDQENGPQMHITGSLNTASLPFAEVSQIKILGLLVDYRFCFQQHTAQLLGQAKTRMGILARASGFTWGLETNVLRITAGALVTSLLRYEVSVHGSGPYEQFLSRIDTCIINITARRVIGAGRSTRFPVLLATAGMKSIRNLYLQHNAKMLDSSLRATSSPIQTRLCRWAARVYQMTD